MIKTLLKVAFVLLVTYPFYSHAQDANSSAGSQSSSSIKSSQGNDQSSSLTYAPVTNNEAQKGNSKEFIVANPGMAYEAGGMSYSNFNCANSQGGAASSPIISLALSGSKESMPCNFRAEAAAHAQFDGSDYKARNAMAMADFAICTNAPKKVLNACVQLGMVQDKDTPAITTQDVWHACHDNEMVFNLCKTNHLVSQNDVFVQSAPTQGPTYQATVNITQTH